MWSQMLYPGTLSKMWSKSGLTTNGQFLIRDVINHDVMSSAGPTSTDATDGTKSTGATDGTKFGDQIHDSTVLSRGVKKL